MATRTSFNKNNSAVKRIMQEARELQNDPSTEYTAAPLEDNLFEWHCTLRGAPETDFEGGLYHFRILLPAEYPFRPPSIMMLTPSGRFETNTQLCISFTNYHEELWQPAWGVRTAIIGLQGFFPLKGQAAMGVGSMEAPGSERRRLAKLSRDWVCPQCKIPNRECLPDPLPAAASSSSQAQDQTSSSSPSSTCTKGGSEHPLEKVPSSTDEDGRSNLSTNTNTEEGKDRCASAERGEGITGSSPSAGLALASGSPLAGSDVRAVGIPEHQHQQQHEQEQRARNADGRDPQAKGEAASTGSVSVSSSSSSRSVAEDQDQDQEQRVEIVSVATTSAGSSVHVSHSRPHPSSSSTMTMTTSTASGSSSNSSPRPPILLDAAISVLLVLVAALLARKVL